MYSLKKIELISKNLAYGEIKQKEEIGEHINLEKGKLNVNHISLIRFD